MTLFRHISLLYCCVALLAGAQTARAASVEFFLSDSTPQTQDYADQTIIPPGFGGGEFTFELWIRPNENFPVGPVGGGQNQLRNWAEEDVQPYSASNWWFTGNFLLDGHNNSSFSEGTFTLQFYGGGRVRWLFGDNSTQIRNNGGLWSVGAYPATDAPSLLDGAWHQVTLVRRFPPGQSGADLELWIDGALVATETTDLRADMRQWWDNWSGYPGNQEGWFWGTEKEAAIGIQTFEDYKGLVDEMRFWSRAKSPAEIAGDYDAPVVGNENGLVGWYPFSEGQGGSVCDALDSNRCLFLLNTVNNPWSPADAPVSGGSGGDTVPPSIPGNVQGNATSSSQVSLTWTPSTDNVGVTGYRVRRGGTVVASPAGTNFNDSGLAANTGYSYTVAARDAAGNFSAESAPVVVTTQAAPDTEAPTMPIGLQGNSPSGAQIDLSWNASTDNVGVTAYDVRRDGSVVGSPSGTSFSDTGLTPATSYSYTVTARDAAGNASAAAGPVNVMTSAVPDTQAPSTPTGLQGSPVSPSAVDLSWNAAGDNVGVTAYRVRRDGAFVADNAATSFSDTGLAANTAYTYTVAARDAAGNESAESSGTSVTTLAGADTQAPTVPGSLQATAASSTRVDLEWTAATDNVGVTSYTVLRDGATVGSTATTAYADTGLTAGTQYRYSVAANDAAGNQSPASVAVSVRTAADTGNDRSSGGSGSASIATLLFVSIAILYRRRFLRARGASANVLLSTAGAR